MRLKAGAVREMHWHVPDEWGFVLKGRMRITAVDQDGHAFQDDISEGNIWNFPGGIPHSLQGLEGDGCEFLLVFNDGNFNEDETFLVTDFLAHIPKEVLAKNFGVPESAFANIPKEELYIFESQVPGPLAADRVVGAGPVPVTYSHRLMDQEPIQTKGGRVRIVDSSNFPAAKDDRRRTGRGRARRDARAALAPELGRVAIPHRGPVADDGVRLRFDRGHLRLPAGRCRLRAEEHAPLHREHGHHNVAVPRAVEDRQVLRRLAGAVVGVHAV